MRLHQLTLVAFGPFPDTEQVDFDRLHDAGLFLLAGATGGGKTSLLDAVCFALYGDVPGDRSSAKRLRCDLAAPTVAPRVELEFTIACRRFRVVRSPSWERAKKRGTGTTKVPTSVALSERVAGQWTHLTSRADEAGQLITDLVGLSLAQFTQVALLPQGRFQAFLRARSEDRQRVLEQLFGTARFAEIERWLSEHRRALGRTSRELTERVGLLVGRVSEVAEAAEPAAWSDPVLSPGDRAEVVAQWVRESAAHQRSLLDEATADLPSARARIESAREAWDQACRLQALRAAHQEAERQDARLAGEPAARRERAAQALAVGATAEKFRVALQLAAEATTRHEEAQRATAQRRAEICSLAEFSIPEESDDVDRQQEAVARLLAESRRRLTAGQRLQREAELLTAGEQDLRRLAGQRDQLDAELAATQSRASALPEELTGLRARQTEAFAASASLAVAQGQRSSLLDQLAAQERVVSLSAQLAELSHQREVALATLNDRKQHWLDLREARLEGMAAEIAGSLVAGCHCPVCGSSEHPHPARPRTTTPDAAAERAAQSLVDDAEVLLHATSERLREIATSLEVARAACHDRSHEDIAGDLLAVEGEMAGLRSLAEGLPALQQQLDRCETEVDTVMARLADLRVRASSLAEQHQGLTKTLETASAILEAFLSSVSWTGGSRRDDTAEGLPHRLTTWLAQQERVVDALESLGEALAVSSSVGAAAREQTTSLLADVKNAGFASIDVLHEALLSERRRDELAAQVEAHDHEVSRVQSVLTDPETLAAVAAPPPDLDRCRSRLEEADALLATLTGRAMEAERRLRRLESHAADLRRLLADWLPVQAEWGVVSELAAFVEGRSADNRLAMRLSAYVLDWRLQQVVDAANERLSAMSDQRYSLQHTRVRGAGEQRGGLSLLIRDDWSGEHRDPATLSGGETFVVSLALALGLADVITQEAGGADLDTLFVDEGFGTLDAETLDDVLGVLDGLREGGRLVGVVSHVSELRDRIPTQLRVIKRRHGSSVEQDHA